MERRFVARAAARSYGAVGLCAAFVLPFGVVAMYKNPASWPVLARPGPPRVR